MNKNQGPHKFRKTYFIVIVAFVFLVSGITILSWHIALTDSAADRQNNAVPVISDTAPEKILFLYSYDVMYDTFDDDLASVKNTLLDDGIDCDVICMDAKFFNSHDDLTAFYDLLKQRMTEVSYSGVITSDDIALQFVLDNRNKLFRGLPVTYFGVNSLELAAKASLDPLIAGYLEDDCIGDTIRLARELMPEATNVVGIYDDTLSGHGVMQSFLSVAKMFPEVHFSTLNFSEYTEKTIRKKIAGYSDDTILLCMTANIDGDNDYYRSAQAARLLSDAAGIPIFHCSTGGYKSGYTCGVYTNFSRVAELTAQKMVTVLDDKAQFSALDKPLTTKENKCYTYNYGMMHKYDLDTSVFPADTIIVDAPQDFFKTYSPVLTPFLLILCGLLLLMSYMRFIYRESRNREKDLQAAIAASDESRTFLHWNASHDPLTGLVNWRTAASDREVSDRNGHHYAAALIDIDNFKMINDTYGHDSGDGVLCALAERLKNISRSSSFRVSRYEGDEFLILFNRQINEYDEELMAVNRVFHSPVKVSHDMIVPAVSIGVANSHGQSDTEIVIRNADIALSQAKKKGKDLIAFYTEDMNDEVNTELFIKSAIADAAEHDGFTMVYQPQIDVRTGETIGLEALVRMPGTSLTPGVFIPVAESSGWIREIGRITTEKTIRQIAEWRKEGTELHPVSINFSFSQTGDKQFVPYLQSLLTQYDISPSLVELEITERFFLGQNRQTTDTIAQLRNMGIRLLLDDFGTGYSSLGNLCNIPVDGVKIDKSFVDNYLLTEQDNFLQDIIRLAHDIGKQVIVEGVETEQQFLRLKEFNADCIQGFYFSKPLSPDQVPGFRAKTPQ